MPIKRATTVKPDVAQNRTGVDDLVWVPHSDQDTCVLKGSRRYQGGAGAEHKYPRSQKKAQEVMTNHREARHPDSNWRRRTRHGAGLQAGVKFRLFSAVNAWHCALGVGAREERESSPSHPRVPWRERKSTPSRRKWVLVNLSLEDSKNKPGSVENRLELIINIPRSSYSQEISIHPRSTPRGLIPQLEYSDYPLQGTDTHHEAASQDT
ncbi:hypothetical protein FB45DRAFT_869513 [Roridomyces roridus]|uniref:Uncharacterized protein n=1 Tax=Roridomyces roridus TaxID=1738132 RepID=A0AAD7BM14_9AGAR|nr:hypothetical protein FB45DRAFT_869513 [Roridomyces roridus]